MKEREFWMAVRQGLLMMVDAIERMLDIDRTADARRFWKDNN